MREEFDALDHCKQNKVATISGIISLLYVFLLSWKHNFLPEGVVLELRNLAWASKSQKYKDSFNTTLLFFRGQWKAPQINV